MFVLVGAPDDKFAMRDADFNWHQARFRLFSLVVLWSYFITPANDSSFIFGFSTLNPDDAETAEQKAWLECPMNGYDHLVATKTYRALRDELREEALLTASRWVPDYFAQNSDAIFKLARLRYFSSGLYSNKILKAIHKKYPNGV